MQVNRYKKIKTCFDKKDKKIQCDKIKVVAVDMDGTLLNQNHELSQGTYEVIRKAQCNGIRFIITTGRDYKSARMVLEKYDLSFDYIVASGAEIRNSEGIILNTIPIRNSCLIDIYKRLESIPVMVRFCTNGVDYFIGSRNNMMQGILEEIKLFDMSGSDETIMQSEIFKERIDRFCCVSSLNEFLEKNVPIYKVYISSDNIEAIKMADRLLSDIDNIASASSFCNNVELTDIKAQKGPVLKEYVQSLGYSMHEVMAIGDSMNDYSMLSMDFGMTVAMANGMEKVKSVAKYITKTNEELGVAYAIEKFCRL